MTSNRAPTIADVQFWHAQIRELDATLQRSGWLSGPDAEKLRYYKRQVAMLSVKPSLAVGKAQRILLSKRPGRRCAYCGLTVAIGTQYIEDRNYPGKSHAVFYHYPACPERQQPEDGVKVISDLSLISNECLSGYRE